MFELASSMLSYWNVQINNMNPTNIEKTLSFNNNYNIIVCKKRVQKKAAGGGYRERLVGKPLDLTPAPHSC